MKKLILSMALLLGAFNGIALAETTQKYIVKLKKGVNPKSLKFSRLKGRDGVKSLKTSFGQFFVVDSKTMRRKSLQSLRDDPQVEYIEKNQIFKISPLKVEKGEKIRDSRYKDQWALNNTGRNSGGWWFRGVAGEDVSAEEAWTMTKGSKSIKIAVIDTGIDYNHRDLKDNIWTNEEELNGIEGVDDDGNGYIDDIHGYDFANKDGDPMDGHGHGTHCAGNIGALHNKKGIRGVMSDVEIVGIKFLTDSGMGSTETAIESINYAIKAGVQIMSNSWGGGEGSQALKDAIIAANEAGIVFVVAAGNEYNNNDSYPTYPASYDVDNVITIGAMTGKGKKARFSNYGVSSVHVFAPGTEILSTITDNRYTRMSGTSMATPIAAGVIGLLLTENPNLTPVEVKERVMATAVRNGLEKYSRAGRIDAERLLLNTRQ